MTKKWLKTVIIGSFLGLTPALFAKGDIDSIPSNIAVSSYIVKEVGSSEILMSKNQNKRIAPASLTKILTSIIAIESNRLGEEVTITREATLVEPTKAGLRVGDRVRLVDLVRAAMVNSSNDAATAIGIHLAGSVPAFAQMMNDKAELIGMKNSHFTNPAGFDKGEHYSSASDLLLLSEYAIKNPIFNDIVKLDSVAFKTTNTNRTYTLHTHNRLLDKYKYSIGIKTGYTNKAGACLIARAKKDNKDVLVIMLKSKANRWVTAENLFEKAFSMDKPEPATMEEEDRPQVQSTNKRAADRKVAKKYSKKSQKVAKKSPKKSSKIAKKSKAAKSKVAKKSSKKSVKLARK